MRLGSGALPGFCRYSACAFDATGRVCSNSLCPVQVSGKDQQSGRRKHWRQPEIKAKKGEVREASSQREEQKWTVFAHCSRPVMRARQPEQTSFSRSLAWSDPPRLWQAKTKMKSARQTHLQLLRLTARQTGLAGRRSTGQDDHGLGSKEAAEQLLERSICHKSFCGRVTKAMSLAKLLSRAF